MSQFARIAGALRDEPTLVGAAGPAAIGHLAGRARRRPSMLVGTHHKVLTVYLSKTFLLFGGVTGRRVSIGRGPDTDASAAIVLDHHSQFDPDLLDGRRFGLHVRRDPRDLLVSAAHYHRRATEPQLLRPRRELGGRSYQDHVNALATFEEVLLFELDHSAGRNVRDMVEWDYESSPLTELRYEDLVTPSGGEVLAAAIADWPIPRRERTMLVRAFDHYSAFGGGHRRKTHIRDPRAGQWSEHFTPAVRAAFDTRFPDAVERLGYDQEDGAGTG